MATSTRFAVACHILTALAVNQGRPVRSEQIANSADTHPSVVRRLLISLADSGLTTSRLGQGGGALLARAAEDISLLDVFRAVEDPQLVCMHRGTPSRDCFVGDNIQSVLGRVTREAESAFFDRLGATTLAEIATEVEAQRDRRAATSRSSPD